MKPNAPKLLVTRGLKMINDAQGKMNFPFDNRADCPRNWAISPDMDPHRVMQVKTGLTSPAKASLEAQNFGDARITYPEGGQVARPYCSGSASWSQDMETRCWRRHWLRLWQHPKPSTSEVAILLKRWLALAGSFLADRVAERQCRVADPFHELSPGFIEGVPKVMCCDKERVLEIGIDSWRVMFDGRQWACGRGTRGPPSSSPRCVCLFCQIKIDALTTAQLVLGLGRIRKSRSRGGARFLTFMDVASRLISKLHQVIYDGSCWSISPPSNPFFAITQNTAFLHHHPFMPPPSRPSMRFQPESQNLEAANLADGLCNASSIAAAHRTSARNDHQAVVRRWRPVFRPCENKRVVSAPNHFLWLEVENWLIVAFWRRHICLYHAFGLVMLNKVANCCAFLSHISKAINLELPVRPRRMCGTRDVQDTQNPELQTIS
ncbi:uncharacterized protein BDR25DRAFT_349407 [Lindgomyces ingoldianus]|uniref:Uncharacterized protein n=1 Tax=Lindgomyces ingoldianus TaxID=673940 RepID=A0ACB6RCR3_9PLEO|nr:uncharacterized protein BDR25DRAFT_349407 [Lindgomyces ingoldianus]KAF2476307.1 hypothetical protein BDR25DRAFT_349407 [Lindgomyces ingoldianus]